VNFLTRLLANSLALLFWALPTKVLWWASCFLAWLWFDVFRIRRWTVLRNLTIAFPEKSHSERLGLARQSMRYLCYNFFEFCMLPRMTKSWVDQNIIFHGLDIYAQAVAQKKGVLLLSLHIGNGDFGIATLALLNLRMNLISKRFKNAFLNQFWFGVREALGTRFLEAHGPSLPFDILKACKANQSVVFVIDQFMGKPYGISSRFFGRKTGTAYGLALFAMKTKAPVLPVYTYRDEHFKTHVFFDPPISWQANEDKDLQISQMTQRYNDEVERIVRKKPEQWMWVHRRWKKWE